MSAEMGANRNCSVGGNGIKLYSNIVLQHRSAAISLEATEPRERIFKKSYRE